MTKNKTKVNYKAKNSYKTANILSCLFLLTLSLNITLFCQLAMN